MSVSRQGKNFGAKNKPLWGKNQLTFGAFGSKHVQVQGGYQKMHSGKLSDLVEPWTKTGAEFPVSKDHVHIQGKLEGSFSCTGS